MRLSFLPIVLSGILFFVFFPFCRFFCVFVFVLSLELLSFL